MFKIVLDPTKCDGCRTCEAVCACVNEGEANPAKARIRVVRTIEQEILYSIPVFCMQCERAACEEVCPRHAISRGPNGVLSVDENEVRRLPDVRDSLPGRRGHGQCRSTRVHQVQPVRGS